MSRPGKIQPLQRSSPNRDPDRGGDRPRAIVLHTSAGTFEGAARWFGSAESGVSAHYLVGLDGRVAQFADETETARHAGRVLDPTARIAADADANGVNRFTVGIEFEDGGDPLAVSRPASQYETGALLIAEVAARWDIPLDRDHVVGHREIFAAKACPGNLDVDRLVARARELPVDVAGPVKPDPAAINPVFVVGVPRSGTTWVQRMLAMHPEAWALLETYMFSRQVGLGALLRSLPQPTPEQGIDLPPPGLGRIFSRDELVAELRAIAERWLARGSDGSRFVVEKTPWHLSDLELIAEVLTEARFVHVIRDGRDVAVSVAAARSTWSRFAQTSGAQTVREIAGLWSDAMLERERWQLSIGERLLEVRYEEVRADPAEACRHLFAHCRMPHDERLVTEAVRATELDRSVRPPREDRAVRSGLIGQWRDRFGVRDGWSFERRAGEALRATGYEPDARWWRHCRVRSRL